MLSTVLSAMSTYAHTAVTVSSTLIITALFITVKVTNDNEHPLAGIYLSLNPWGDTVGNSIRALAWRESQTLWLSFFDLFSYLNVVDQLGAAPAGAHAKQGLDVQNNQLSTAR